MSNIITKALCAAAAMAVTTAGFATSASAQNSISRSVEVKYADLDLTSADGKATLENRLKGAVRSVCGGYDPRSLTDMRDHHQCVDQASTTAKRATVTLLTAAAAGEPIETAMVIRN